VIFLSLSKKYCDSIWNWLRSLSCTSFPTHYQPAIRCYLRN